MASMHELAPVRTALLSVSDKTDLVPFAKRLARHGVKLISTGGTAKTLEAAGLEVTPVEEVTGFPEIMDGRVKTLHPKIHGGLLGRRDDAGHLEAMQAHAIETIDLVCVNLYPFEETIRRENVSFDAGIEQIDIGGPSMIRSAAKNCQSVTVVTSARQYDAVCNDLDAHEGETTLALRRQLAAAAFARTAAYDTAIAQWMSQRASDLGSGAAGPMTDPMLLRLDRAAELRYGENPHQRGALYLEHGRTEATVARARQLHGKALSFNNLYDADGALELVKEVDGSERAAVAVIKHANPCGFAVGEVLSQTFERAWEGDPLAAFGGIVALNRVVDPATAERLAGGERFVEVVVAPDFEDEATRLLAERWKNVRLLAVGALPPPGRRDTAELAMKRITGGLLVQDRDLARVEPGSWSHEAGPAPTEDLLETLTVAMLAVKHLKSNAVCLAAGGALVGAGPGQVDRLTACRLAVEKAGARAEGSVAASDAFFPFRDGPDRLIEAGVRAIVEPGGSKRDPETIEACEAAGVSLLFTGRRHFRH